jgi:hypothetical protein
MTLRTEDGLMCFELDKKGNLISKKAEPHHISLNTIPRQPPNVPTPTQVTSPTEKDENSCEEFAELFESDWELMQG